MKDRTVAKAAIGGTAALLALTGLYAVATPGIPVSPDADVTWSDPEPEPTSTVKIVDWQTCVDYWFEVEPTDARFHACDRDWPEEWIEVTPILADALAESGLPDADTRDWEVCLYLAPQSEQAPARVDCPDGFMGELK